MIEVKVKGQFALGQIVASKNAADTLNAEDILTAIKRHAQCDWGDLTEDDRALNDLSLVDDARLLSAYVDRNGTKFWVITEWDRSVTTVLLPEDY